MSDRDTNSLVARRPRWALVAVLLGGAIGVDGGFLIHFSNLRSNGFILALALLTPVLIGLALAITPLVLPRMPQRAVVMALRSVAALIVAVDAVVFLGPLFAHGAIGHDTAPKFVANATPTPALMTSPVAQTATATAIGVSVGPFMFTFSPTTGEGSTSGTALLGATTTGNVVLHLHQFHTLDGPNLHVFLSRITRPHGDADVRNGYDLGPLLATDGNKDYAVPTGVDVSQIHSVVIYCLSFNAIFGYAQ